MTLAPAAALTLAALASLAGGSKAMAADAAVAVDVLYVFAGEVGKGSQPSSPPVYYDSSLYGQTNSNGSVVSRGGIYRLSVAADATGVREYESVNHTLTGSSSGMLLTASDGKVYGGNSLSATSTSLYYFGPAVPLMLSDTLLTGSSSVIAAGQWAMDTEVGSAYRDSIYFFSGGSQATNALYRYSPGTGVTQIGATRTDSNVRLNYPAALALDGQWLYGTQVDFNTSYVPEAYLYRIGLDGNGFEKIVTLGAGTDDAGKPLGWPFNTSITNATVAAGNRMFSALLNGGDGWLYGTTYSQVAPAISGLQATSLGTVYRMALQPDDAGKFSTQVLHTFQGGTDDGQAASGTLVKADDGNLYGTTMTGGANGFGTLWRIVLSGDEPSYEKLYDFDKATSGATPIGLSQGEPYVLYGAAAYGGKEGATTINSGTLFRVELPKPDAAFTTPLAADVTDVAYGGSIKLSWAAEHAASCTASGSNASLWSGAKETSGTDVAVGPLTQEGENTFILSCASTYGDAVATSETVTVTVAANPDNGGGDDDGGNSGGNDGGSDGGDDTSSPVSSGGGGAAALGLLGLMAGAWTRRHRVSQR